MSFWRTYYHLVWTTKNREPLITPEIEARLYPCLIHKGAELGAYTYAINGWNDHIHMVVTIPPHVSVADLVKLLKGASSHDLNQQMPTAVFSWQRGYGVLTLGQRQRPDAEAYVRKQKEHHADRKSITWLETCTEDDEGPTDRSSAGLQPFPTLGEERAQYVVSGDQPAF